MPFGGILNLRALGRTRRSDKFLVIDILAVLGEFGSLVLFGVLNARNYQCHSTMGSLQEMTISCSV